MALAEADDLSDIFFGPALAGAVAGTRCDNCDNCDKRATARVCGRSGGLRQPATSCYIGATAGADVADVAACRKVLNRPESEHWRGLSQMSQMSQAPDALPAAPPGSQSAQPAALARGTLTNVDFAPTVADPAAHRFAARRARLIRWGWSQDEAQAMAERLARRDLSGDDMESCTECAHYRPGRCGNHRRAGLFSPEVGRDLAALLQRCPGFRP